MSIGQIQLPQGFPHPQPQMVWAEQWIKMQPNAPPNIYPSGNGYSDGTLQYSEDVDARPNGANTQQNCWPGVGGVGLEFYINVYKILLKGCFYNWSRAHFSIVPGIVYWIVLNSQKRAVPIYESCKIQLQLKMKYNNIKSLFERVGRAMKGTRLFQPRELSSNTWLHFQSNVSGLSSKNFIHTNAL